MEGLLDGVLADSDDGYWFRRNVEVVAVPFMDKDGVEEGDQGKNRKPRDHNRDYIGKSIHPSVAALRTFVPNWSNGKLKVALDLHSPHIRGPHNEVIYLVGEGSWRPYQSFVVGPEPNYVHHEFPDGFSAHWVRVKVDKDCRATVYFTYN